jgi:murein DD-endopeptidase MepM/ murein hydrolase activator NlpD
MTRTERSFPVAFRVLATACAVFALAWFVPSAGAAPDEVTQGDLDDAQAAADALERDLGSLNAELAEIQRRLNEAAFEVDRQEGLLQKITAELMDTRERIEKARGRYDRIRVRLNDRAAEAFISGPGSNLAFFLGAQSMADLSDRIEFVDAVAQSDASLAQQVENLGNQLLADQEKLERLKAERAEQVTIAKEREKQVAADLARQQEVRNQIAAKFEEARSFYRQQKEARADWLEHLREQRAAAAVAAASAAQSSAPLPPGAAGILQACPVDQPRGFGDGFGAPRYVGGYHPHRGVDIVAPEGTPVRAAFSGYARDATNLYGGTSVIVQGQYGYVYNAHLSSIAKLGAVSAGDVIGYVSSTGLAGGTTPHNHFEFHPNVIPSGWPSSYYGYSVIGTAVNPYPLLIAACS